MRIAGQDLGQLVGSHLVLALVPVVLGLLVALPLGWWAHRSRVVRAVLVPLSGALYTIPSLALFVAMPLILGTRILDPVNIAVALTVYTVALLVRSVTDALDAVPREVVTAAVAMGYRPVALLLSVQLPMAVPVLTAGVRVASVSAFSLVTVGALIGGTSLGSLFTVGFENDDTTAIVLGIVLTVGLAFLADAGWSLLGRLLAPWDRVRVGR